MTPFSAERLIREFWRLMATNDFGSVATVLAEDFVLEWPQSCERFRGPENFCRMNAEYPHHGVWTFEIQRLLAQGDAVVTDVLVADGVQNGRAISFFTVLDGKIVRIVEFWPEPFKAPAHRAHLVDHSACRDTDIVTSLRDDQPYEA